MSMIHFQVEMQDLREIEQALGMAKDKSKLVLRAAINNTAKEVERRMTKEASKRYALNEGGVGAYRAITKVDKAKTTNLVATVTARDTKTFDLYKYKLNDRTYYPGSRGAPSWIKAKQLKRSSLKRLSLMRGGSGDAYKAFVVRYQNGHLALAERVPGSHMKRNPAKEALKSLYATSKPKAEEFVYKEFMEEDMNDVLMRNIEAQIHRFLG